MERIGRASLVGIMATAMTAGCESSGGSSTAPRTYTGAGGDVVITAPSKTDLPEGGITIQKISRAQLPKAFRDALDALPGKRELLLALRLGPDKATFDPPLKIRADLAAPKTLKAGAGLTRTQTVLTLEKGVLASMEDATATDLGAGKLRVEGTLSHFSYVVYEAALYEFELTLLWPPNNSTFLVGKSFSPRYRLTTKGHALEWLTYYARSRAHRCFGDDSWWQETIFKKTQTRLPKNATATGQFTATCYRAGTNCSWFSTGGLARIVAPTYTSDIILNSKPSPFSCVNPDAGTPVDLRAEGPPAGDVGIDVGVLPESGPRADLRGEGPPPGDIGIDVGVLPDAGPLAPVAHWPLDEGTGIVARDVAGANHFSVVAAGWLAKAACKRGKSCYRITNPTGRPFGSTVVASKGLPTGAAPRTIAAWVFPESKPRYAQAPIAQYGDATAGAAFGIWGSGHPPFFQVYTGDKFKYLQGKTRAAWSRWYHVAATYDGTTVRLYVNGKLDASQTMTLTTTIGSRGVEVGKNSGTAWTHKGLIDDVRIYRRALSAAELSKL